MQRLAREAPLCSTPHRSLCQSHPSLQASGPASQAGGRRQDVASTRGSPGLFPPLPLAWTPRGGLVAPYTYINIIQGIKQSRHTTAAVFLLVRLESDQQEMRDSRKPAPCFLLTSFITRNRLFFLPSFSFFLSCFLLSFSSCENGDQDRSWDVPAGRRRQGEGQT